MRSRRLLLWCGAGALLLAAIFAVLEVPGVGTWIAAAALAGLASAVSALVVRGTDVAVKRGREAVVEPAPLTPITVTAWHSKVTNSYGLVLPLPEGHAACPECPRVCVRTLNIHLAVEAAVERAVILTSLTVQVESRSSTPPDLQILARPKPRARPRRTFDLRYRGSDLGVDLGAPEPMPKPAEGVPDFPYTVSPDDPEYFVLQTKLETPGDITWRVGIHWVYGGEAGVVLADDGGQPFRLVTPRPSPVTAPAAASRRPPA
ncbi:hypothetical protein SAMN05216533_8573 [Streptomyces sp. Ag109_O5-10]|nr:hypothetical protein SAMN05216533_8573 [Streptomyces sp. Ag109_O5-10]